MKGLYLRLKENSFKVANYLNILKWTFVGLLVVIFGRSKKKNEYDPESTSSFTPIFIIGHWRSGTTYLQKALCAIRAFDFVSVSDVTTSACPPIASHIINTGTNAFFSIFNIEDKFQRVRFTVDMPMEELHAMMFNNCYDASSWAFIFPKKAAEYFQTYLFAASNEQQKKMDINYQGIIQRILKKKKSPKYMILKSPENTARIGRLLTMYPNAKFIFIHRDPFDVYHSCLRFWDIVGADFSVQDFSKTAKEELIMETYQKILDSYIAQRGLLSSKNLVELEYNTILASPLETICDALTKLGLMNEAYKTDIEDFLLKSDIKDYKVNEYIDNRQLRIKLAKDWKIGYDLWNEIKSQ